MSRDITLEYDPINEDETFRDDYDEIYPLVVMVSQIVRFTKSPDGEITYIHLANGEILSSSDSIKTLNARLNRPSD